MIRNPPQCHNGATAAENKKKLKEKPEKKSCYIKFWKKKKEEKKDIFIPPHRYIFRSPLTLDTLLFSLEEYIYLDMADAA